MQIRYAFSELGSGLRRNLTMTIAVVVTVWVSLVLFGVGLLLSAEVDLAKGYWYERVQLSVFMCNDLNARSGLGTCSEGSITDNQRAEIETILTESPRVQEVFHETQKRAYERFQETYKDAATAAHIKPGDLQESFRVSLKDPREYQGVASAVEGMAGVANVEDSRRVLDPLFKGLNGLQWLSIGLAGGLLVAAVLQIGTTIRLTVFSRRREIGIMRLVGASNFYIQLPFIVEAVVAAMIGVVLACGTLALTPLVTDRLREGIRTVPWVGWEETFAVMPVLAAVGAGLAILASFVTLRKYLEI